MRVAAIMCVLMLAGCASYTPRPLDSNSGALAAPVAQVLEQQASQIKRPWLAPVAVDLSAPLTPDAIAAVTVVNNPDLIALRARAGVSDAQVFSAGLLPDPTFSIGISKVLSGPDTLHDLSSALGFDLNALRTRAVRRQQAVAQDKQVRLDLAWAEWQTAGQARLQAVRILRLETIATMARASHDAARSLLERVNRAALRGDIAGDRLQAASLAANGAHETMVASESDLATARMELRKLMGLPPGFPLALAAPAPLAAPPSAETLFAIALENRTDLAALQAGYEAQEATVHQEVMAQFPNLGLTLNSQRDSAGNFLLGPSIDFTLPLWNRNRGAIAVERATREALRAEYDARLFQTRADIAAASAGIVIALQRRAESLADIPKLEHFADASRQAAKRGDLSLETADNAEQTLRDRRMQLAQAQQNCDEQMIALELLTGTPKEAWPR